MWLWKRGCNLLCNLLCIFQILTHLSNINKTWAFITSSRSCINNLRLHDNVLKLFKQTILKTSMHLVVRCEEFCCIVWIFVFNAICRSILLKYCCSSSHLSKLFCQNFNTCDMNNVIKGKDIAAAWLWYF